MPTVTLEQFNALKARAAEAQKHVGRAEGAAQSARATLEGLGMPADGDPMAFVEQCRTAAEQAATLFSTAFGQYNDQFPNI